MQRAAHRASLEDPFRCVMGNPKQLYEWCVANIPAITFAFVSQTDVKAAEKFLSPRVDLVKTVKLTRSNVTGYLVL